MHRYAFRPGLGLMQPSLAAALEEVGFKVNVIMTRDGNYDNSGYDDDWTEIVKRRENGDWDLLMWAQNTLPAGDPAQFLNAFFRTGAGRKQCTNQIVAARLRHCYYHGSTPSTRRLFDGVAMSVSYRSTEPGRPRHRREMT